MNDFVICTDTACDVRAELLKEWGVPCFDMTFRFEGEDKEYTESDISISEFYDRMKKGGVAKTAAINPVVLEGEFDKFLASGKDVLYLAFSSGLSTTCNSGCMAASEIAEQYPDRTIVTVDSLCASAGQGLLLYLALQKQKQGASLAETAAYLEKTKLHLCHWFTVDDLVYLKRGGRVSAAVALVGAVLGIKPVLHVDDEGHLINITKVRGRKAALNALVQKFEELAEPKDGTVFISHADCPDDAAYVKEKIENTFGAKVELVTEIGPVIGAHSGPGTLAMFFVGSHR